jgi:hypothetical protein
MPPNQQRPDPNLLDLRRVFAEQQAAAKRSRRRPVASWRPHRSGQTIALSRPTVRPRDWAMFRRELLKFCVVIAIVCLSGWIVAWITGTVKSVQAVSSQARQGANELQSGFSGLGQAKGAAATTAFTSAISHFTSASHELDRAVGTWGTRLPYFGAKIAAIDTVLTNTTAIAQAGVAVSQTIPSDATIASAVSIQNDGVIHGSVGVLTTLLQERDVFARSVATASAAIGNIAAIPAGDLPSSVRTTFADWQRLYNGMVGSKGNLESFTSLLVNLFAPSAPKEYLVIFQNNDEIRASGGFTGTFLLVKFDHGTFSILDAPGNGPFALSDIVAKKNLPPQPILSIAPFWTFHDANWWLDFPLTAKTLIQFYQDDRGFAPDGVITLTPSIMEDLLRITGPIRPAKYALDITAENFVRATEEQVQFNYDKALNNPKQFLIDLVPELLTKLSQLPSADALQALAVTLKHATQNDFLMYSSDPKEQTAIANLGWDGAIHVTDGDYLAVIDSNLGGGKTDRFITEKVDVEVKIDGGQIRHEVTITRRHNGDKNDPLTSAINRDFIRVYAPSNSQFVGVTGMTIPSADWFLTPDPAAKMIPLLQAGEGQVLVDPQTGIRITHESGKLVMGAWSRIAPGDDQTLTFTYTTPAPTGKSRTWNLVWQHQPGAFPIRQWTLNISTPSGTAITSVSTPGRQSGKRNVRYSFDSTLSRTASISYSE